MSLSTGDIIDGKYRIVRLLGEGGMGAVYEGENLRIHRRVAIKVLHSGVAEMADAVQRFEREAQAAGRIGSEHIVEVLDLGNLPNSDRYMVMEYLDGESLSSRIQGQGRLVPGQIYPIAAQLLDGLAAAHGAGIIHRDLKPDNVYLLRSRGGRADFVKLLDFGISKFNQLSGDSGFSMTRTGAVMGTPYYMAPEQAKGARDLDHRVDLYAAGVILYECLTGRVPFNANTFNELLFKIVLEQPPPIEELVPDVDQSFAAIVRKAMARERDERFGTCAEFRQALDAWAQANPGVSAMPAVVPSGGSAPALGGGTPTPGTWAQTGAHDPNAAAPKKKTGLIIALAAVGILVLGGAGVGFKLSRDHSAEAAAAAAASAEEQSKAERAQGQKELVAEQQKAEAARQEADRLRQEAQRALEDAKSVKDTKQRAEAEKAAEEKVQAAQRAEKTAQTAKAAVVATPRATTVEVAKPKPTATQEPSVAGRKIRTSL